MLIQIDIDYIICMLNILIHLVLILAQDILQKDVNLGLVHLVAAILIIMLVIMEGFLLVVGRIKNISLNVLVVDKD